MWVICNMIYMHNGCRVPCQKGGGIKFTLNGNPHFNLLMVFNVGGAGDVMAVYIKGTHTGWLTMKRNWGDRYGVGGPGPFFPCPNK